LISIYFGSLYSSQQAVNWIDEGFVKKIRGVTFSTKVSSQFESSMIRAARGIINPLISDVHIFTDHRSGPPAGKYDSFLLVDILEYFILTFEFIFDRNKIKSYGIKP
jgi:RNA 3'-terminal phosphate cyclase